jgi:transposase
LDVHKELNYACLISTDADGKEVVHKRVFGGFTDDLIHMRKWLKEHKCPVVAMESTGVYWRPIHNILEGHCKVLVVNARHIKNVPGRKTDVLDSEWLAGLLRHGLVRGSFIPSKKVRQWRDLSRTRRTFVESLADEKRRVHKIFETANIKIDSVVSDLFGRTGRNLMALLVKRKKLTSAEVEVCLEGKLRKKGKELFRSVQGCFEEHHRFLLRRELAIIKTIEQEIATINRRLKRLFSPHQELIERLTQIPGISVVSAQAILSEMGPTLETFPSSGQLCSWCGVCPGNNESAGKRRSGRSPVRDHHLKTILIETAWAATKKKDSYYKAKYYSLKMRRGPKRAIVAIAHRMLKAIYHIVKHGGSFQELGSEYLSHLKKGAKLSYLRREAKVFGYRLEPLPEA